MRDDAVVFLSGLGVTGAESDALLDFVVKRVIQDILNDLNQISIPEGLQQTAVYMIAGQYLSLMKGAGKLEGFDLEVAEKQIKEGDTTVIYAIGEGSQTPEQRLDSLISFLSNYGRGQFAAYRRIKW